MQPSYAFFDFDNTLIHGKSMFDFSDDHHRYGGPPPLRPEEFDVPRAEINRRYFRRWRGLTPTEISEAVRAWTHRRTRTGPLWVPAVHRVLRRLQAQGVHPVVVSGSAHELIGPWLRELGIRPDHVLATRPLVVAGRYTGEIATSMIGEGKAAAVRSFAARNAVDLRQSMAFGDHLSDLPLLEAVGWPVAVIGDPALHAAACDRGWFVLDAGGAR